MDKKVSCVEWANGRWTEVPLQSAKLILELSQKRLDHLSMLAQQLSNRAYTAIPINIALLTFAYTVFNRSEDLTMKISSTFSITLIAASLILLVVTVFPRKVMPAGSHPALLFTEKYLFAVDSMLAITLQQIEQCEFNIDFNQKLNEQRHKLFKISVLITVISVITSAAILILPVVKSLLLK